MQYYWNSRNNLGSGEKAIKLGDQLPEPYSDDARLSRWLKDGLISESKPSRDAKTKSELEKLKLENLELSAKIKILTDQIGQNAELSKQKELLGAQNKSLNELLDRLSLLIMENESKISEVIKTLREEKVSKNDRLEAAATLENLHKVDG